MNTQDVTASEPATPETVQPATASQATDVQPSAEPETHEPVANVNANPLSDEEDRYLKSQNLDLTKFGIDSSNHDAVENFINLHKTMRQQRGNQHAQDAQSTPATPATQAKPSDFISQTQPTAPQSQPVQTNTQYQSAHAPSQFDIINMKNYLDNSYPEIKGQLGTKEFYDGMRAYGFSPVTANGEFDVSAITRYANLLNLQAENARLKSKQNVDPSIIPSADNRLELQFNSPQVANMDMNTAENIFMSCNSTLRAGKALSADEQALFNKAKDYIQKNI